ncbi:hypothetical protein E2C01_032551 [Portunus trituberculatus]|uniref:Uncharacterized protein n=1 Tax=Portunus trituberculatus TaxID=210409 RepID=A0A5B7EXT6_PORTR|nr:hypothetical protein [Portunus trituberculatus]
MPFVERNKLPITDFKISFLFQTRLPVDPRKYTSVRDNVTRSEISSSLKSFTCPSGHPATASRRRVLRGAITPRGVLVLTSSS